MWSYLESISYLRLERNRIYLSKINDACQRLTYPSGLWNYLAADEFLHSSYSSASKFKQALSHDHHFQLILDSVYDDSPEAFSSTALISSILLPSLILSRVFYESLQQSSHKKIQISPSFRFADAVGRSIHGLLDLRFYNANSPQSGFEFSYRVSQQ